MSRVKQINIDGSRLQGVDLSKVPNQKTIMPRAAATRLNAIDAAFTQASISAAAAASNAGEWAAIPQDASSGSLSPTIVVPSPTPSSSTGPFAIRPSSVAVTLGLTAVVGPLGGNVDGGVYWEAKTNDFGVLGSLGPTGSTSISFSGAVDILMWDGAVSKLDGRGLTIIVDVGLGKTLFTGFGILVALPSWKVIGYVAELIGVGIGISPPISITVQLVYTDHIQLL